MCIVQLKTLVQKSLILLARESGFATLQLAILLLHTGE
jgi:hypothetical protein